MLRNVVRWIRMSYQLLVGSLLITKRHRQVFLIYTMGKVGSSSVYATLKKLYGVRVFHVHFLGKLLDSAVVRHRDAGRLRTANHLYLSSFIKKRPWILDSSETKIIVLVRDPIAFVISDVYQNPDFYGDLSPRYFQDPDLMRSFLEQKVLLPDSPKIMYWRRWLEDELYGGNPSVSIDLDTLAEQGWVDGKFGGAQLLMIQCERLSEVGDEALKQVTGCELQLNRHRSNDRASIDAIYKEVVRSVKITESCARAIYVSAGAEKFYSHSQLEGFIGRWAK